jgi:RNA polymerase sigma-70 factor (ECF subfamily)
MEGLLNAEAGSATTDARALADEAIVARIRAGERDLFEVLMRRHNRRLYRVARAIVGDDGEAEDVIQEAYVRAFACLDQFAGRARFATWLTRIAVHEALARVRKRARFVDLDAAVPGAISADPDPEQNASDVELRAVLESAVAAIAAPFRLVFVLREIEGLSTEETAESLCITPQTVKTRLHRARSQLRMHLASRARAVLSETFDIGGARCDRVVAAVLARIATE